MNNRFSWSAFEALPVIGIMRNIPFQKAHTLADLYAQSGFTTLEITMNSDQAEETIARLSSEFALKLNIGAGTVLTLEDLSRALSAGAQFIVTPVLNEDVIEACVSQQVPVFPGAYTPSEIYKAWKLGAGMVKVFPATKLGAGFIKDVLSPMNFLKLLPTGGVTVDNCTDFLKAGARGVGMGSELFSTQLIRDEQWETLGKHFLLVSKKIQSYLPS